MSETSIEAAHRPPRKPLRRKRVRRNIPDDLEQHPDFPSLPEPDEAEWVCPQDDK